MVKSDTVVYKAADIGCPVQIQAPRDARTPEEQGEAEAIKEGVKEKETSKKKLDVLLQATKHELYRLSSTPPFDLFPDEIIIDQDKVDVIRKSFFAQEEVHSVLINQLLDVFVTTAPIFAALHIVDKGFVDNEIEVEFLKKNEALKARRILQGLMTARDQGISFVNIPTKELVDKLEKIGEIRD